MPVYAIAVAGLQTSNRTGRAPPATGEPVSALLVVTAAAAAVTRWCAFGEQDFAISAGESSPAAGAKATQLFALKPTSSERTGLLSEAPRSLAMFLRFCSSYLAVWYIAGGKQVKRSVRP